MEMEINFGLSREGSNYRASQDRTTINRIQEIAPGFDLNLLDKAITYRFNTALKTVDLSLVAGTVLTALSFPRTATLVQNEIQALGVIFGSLCAILVGAGLVVTKRLDIAKQLTAKKIGLDFELFQNS